MDLLIETVRASRMSEPLARPQRPIFRPSRTRVLVLGATREAAKHPGIFANGRNFGSDFVGFISNDDRGRLRFRSEQGEQACESLDTVLDNHAIDEVLQVEACVGVDSSDLSYICAVRGITLKTLMRSPLGAVGRYKTKRVGNGEYLLSFETVPAAGMGLAFKRLIDIAAAVVGLFFCAFAGLLFARRIRKETGGSALFTQMRVGRNGRLFKLYKFRTMHISAEERLAELAAHNEMKGHIFKMQDDPRVTPLGRFLRRHYLDELPQFWNVLRGEMSLVGTRPPIRQEVAKYSAHHQRRLSMKPGMTGLWQLSGGKKINDFEEIVRLDCQYIDTWSLWQDCRIIVGTLLKFCHGDGY
ncbi:MAG: sugar transferase [Candidatus Binataceae bacterium]